MTKRLADEQFRRLEIANNAPDESSRRKALDELAAWREGVATALAWKSHEIGAFLMVGDMDYIGRGVDRPMCGGVWLDWTPSAS